MTNGSVTQVCSLDGCSRPRIGRGYCGKHYQRWRKYGDPMKTQICRSDDEDFEARFWEQANPTADVTKCWLWGGAINESGYGKMCLKRPYSYLQGVGRTVMTHRLAYAMYYKNDPGELVVRHRCDTPQCINPHHLILGTVADNNADKKQRGGYFKGGHLKRVYLDENQVRTVRRRVEAGDSRRKIAREMSTSHKVISNIATGKTRRCVLDE